MGKMRIFLRQSTVGREPLAIAMSGVRMGERVLQIGMDTPVVTSLLASKPGLSGESVLVLADEAAATQARRATAESGALVNIAVHRLDALPFERGSFDVVVVHNREGQTLTGTGASQVLSECRRVLRGGGRVIVINRGAPAGLAAIFQARPDPGQTDDTVRAMQTAGFRSVRELGDRDGYAFMEGLNVEGSG
jgi:ubiquinone/menaquinone biosynthesis C-methylase UbiE